MKTLGLAPHVKDEDHRDIDENIHREYRITTTGPIRAKVADEATGWFGLLFNFGIKCYFVVTSALENYRDQKSSNRRL